LTWNTPAAGRHHYSRIILGLLLSLVLPHLPFRKPRSEPWWAAGVFYGVGRSMRNGRERRGAWVGGDVKMMAMIGAFWGYGRYRCHSDQRRPGTLTGLSWFLGPRPGVRRQWRTISLPYGPFRPQGPGATLLGERLLNFLTAGIKKFPPAALEAREGLESSIFRVAAAAAGSGLKTPLLHNWGAPSQGTNEGSSRRGGRPTPGRLRGGIGGG